MSRQEDFDKHSDYYVNERKSYGVNDPYMLKEIGEANYQGCEHGYQYAVKKACDVITSIIMDAYGFDGNPLLPQDIREQFKQAMQLL